MNDMIHLYCSVSAVIFGSSAVQQLTSSKQTAPKIFVHAFIGVNVRWCICINTNVMFNYSSFMALLFNYRDVFRMLRLSFLFYKK
jgi:hypothetical protein